MPESDPNASVADVAEVPPGFSPLQVGGAYFQQLGPVYARRADAGGVVIALRVADRHLNIQGITHGGMPAICAGVLLGASGATARPARSAPRNSTT